MSLSKEAVKKPASRRVEVFTRKHCDNSGKMHNVGDICTLTDDDELALLTERNALKTTVIKG
jgi:hypothetical protein